MASQVQPASDKLSVGLEHWMERVLQELDKAAEEMAADPVHDLRVAIRRCRSIGEAFRDVDWHPAWQKMRKAGKAVFAPLGELRDAQVMLEWIEKLGASSDPALSAIHVLVLDRERLLKDKVSAELRDFDRTRWRSLAKVLTKRAAQIAPGSPVFEYMALERWHRARELHRNALRNRSKASYHQLRIGLKKFRYIIENFLPERLEQWGHDLKQLQDLLGEVHDLDVLWDTFLQSGQLSDPAVRARLQIRISDERKPRVINYRKKMAGKDSPWHQWRRELPQGSKLDDAILAKFRAMASFQDPEPEHAERVTRLALQIYDGLAKNELLRSDGAHARHLLESAGILHDIGRVKRRKNHHKASAQVIGKIAPPEGWRPEDIQIVALVARYHRGSLPRTDHQQLQALTALDQQLTKQLAGVLRLADEFDSAHDGAIRTLTVARNSEIAVIYADGYDPSAPSAERIAAARFLLENTCDFPIVIRPLTPSK